VSRERVAVRPAIVLLYEWLGTGAGMARFKNSGNYSV